LKLKILKKLRTASLNSEFTGSYKKKCTLFSIQKVIKIAQCYSLSFRRLGACSQTSTLASSHYEFLAARLIITSAFMWHKQKMEQNKIKLVLKSAVAAETDINYGKSWRHRLCMTFWNQLCFEKFDEEEGLTSFLRDLGQWRGNYFRTGGARPRAPKSGSRKVLRWNRSVIFPKNKRPLKQK